MNKEFAQKITKEFKTFKSMVARNKHYLVGNQNKNADLDTGDCGIVSIHINDMDQIVVNWKAYSCFVWESTNTYADEVAFGTISDYGSYVLDSSWDADEEGWETCSKLSFVSTYEGENAREACNHIFTEFEKEAEKYHEWHEEVHEALNKIYKEYENGDFDDDEHVHYGEDD